MILYVDETENDDYFIVAGLLVKNERSIELAYRHFKKRIKNYPLKKHAKQKVYVEFKSSILDRHYQRIKRIMLEEIAKMDNYKVLYSVKNKEGQLKKLEKEKTYIDLIIKLAKKCDDISIIYDSFNNPQFEDEINNILYKLKNVIKIKSKNSQEESGLKLIDNLCGVIRLHISNQDINNFYKYISSNVIKI